MLIAGTGRDAERVAEHITTRPAKRETPILVWNGLVTRMRRTATESRTVERVADRRKIGG
jgi:hypothetical protein